MTYFSNLILSWKSMVLICVLMMLGLIIFTFSGVDAAEPLPERPIVPIPPPSINSKIALKVSNTALAENGRLYDEDDWVVVQWQALDGTWYDVDGWQGTFSYEVQDDVNNWIIEWWVDSENYGEKDFRFVVYTNESRDQLKGSSGNFDLPKSRSEAVEVVLGAKD